MIDYKRCKSGLHVMSPENVVPARHGVQCKECKRIRGQNWTRKNARSVEVVCHQCGNKRMVSRDKAYGPQTTTTPRPCVRCGGMFSGRKSAARYCDSCCEANRRPVYTERPCAICNKPFTAHPKKVTCPGPCHRRHKMNATYFGGRMKQADGWEDRQCQLCLKTVGRKYNVHHVFGHPDHSRLAVLCMGCHAVISTLAHRKIMGPELLSRLAWFVMAQRLGGDPNSIELMPEAAPCP